jgi:flagellar basal body-associated protein FliL
VGIPKSSGTSLLAIIVVAVILSAFAVGNVFLYLSIRGKKHKTLQPTQTSTEAPTRVFRSYTKLAVRLLNKLY